MSISVYSSDQLVGNRRAGWQAIIRSVYTSLDIDIGTKESFSARICRKAIGYAELTEVAADREYARRTRQHISRAPSDSYIYLLVQRGRLNVAQFGRNCTVAPGQYTLLHLNHPYLFEHEDRVEKLGFKVPADRLLLREAQLYEHCAVLGSGSSGMGRLVASHISEISRTQLSATEAASHVVSKSATDLLSVLFEGGGANLLPDETVVRAAIRRRCERYIAANYALTDLHPAGIAHVLGISVRYLHQCFEPNGVSVMEFVKDRRLAGCFADLTDPGQSGRPVAEIALRNGFRSVPYFNQAFKTCFGRAPREARAGQVRPVD